MFRTLPEKFEDWDVVKTSTIDLTKEKIIITFFNDGDFALSGRSFYDEHEAKKTIKAFQTALRFRKRYWRPDNE